MFDSYDGSPDEMVAEFEAKAERFETPCGDGVMVWRAWGEGPPVVLFHGAHGSWSHWTRNIAALSQGRRVIAPDLPGFGDSAAPERPEEVENYAEAIAAGLRRLFPGQAVDLLAFSMGGVMAGHVAALAPDVARRVILVGVGGLGTPPGQFPSTRIRGLEGEALREAHRLNLLGLMLYAPEAVDELALRLQALNVPRARVKPGPLVMPDKLLQALPRIRAQVDVIWGEHDRPHPDPEVQADVIRRFHPHAVLRVVRNAGHWVMYEQAEAFNAEALDLLNQPLRAV